ncbi:MAG TPA: PEGA domain-containing protein [Kofleriaceae bacterium]|nr:PEGA domain-containing protein [Kofleriaceae bacterium]
MAGRRAAGILVAALLAGAVPRGAHAQPADPAVAARQARQSLATAQQCMLRGSYFAARKRSDEARAQFEAAVAAYQRAIEAGGDPNLYVDLAAAEDRLGKPIDAVKHLRLVVAAAGARPDVVGVAQARLDELLGKLGLVTLTIVPAGASITLAGSELGTAPLREPLVLAPGTYTLSFQAEGFQPHDEQITVEPGRAEHAIALEPVNIVVAPVPPAPPPEPAARPAPPAGLPLYLGAGVTGAAAITAVVFGVLAIGQHATFTAAATSPAARDQARSRGERFALVADASLGAAVIAAGVTATWYFYWHRSTRPDDQRQATRKAKLDVVPWVQSRSGGAALAGWF